jgi:L-threonylcarbamoyladenylate synthase
MEKILKMLRAGQLLLAPTDTIWGILCDASNPEAVKKVYELKKRPDSKAMVCMVSDINMLKNHVDDLPVTLAEYINDQRPTTVIYNNPVGIAQNAITQESTVAIRIVNHRFCTPLISAFGKPLISTSANISGTPHPKNFSDIANEILMGVDHIVEMDKDKTNIEPSRIIKIEPTGDITFIRA